MHGLEARIQILKEVILVTREQLAKMNEAQFDKLKNKLIVKREKVERLKCDHTYGLAWYDDSVDATIKLDNIAQIRAEYNPNDLEWYKVCPHCAEEIDGFNMEG